MHSKCSKIWLNLVYGSQIPLRSMYFLPFLFYFNPALSEVLLSCLSFLVSRNYQGIGDYPSYEFATQETESEEI